MYFIYILLSHKTHRFYIGSTDNLQRRLYDHNAGNTRSTKPYRPWQIIYSESFGTAHEAHVREFEIKSWKNRRYMLKTLRLETWL